MTELEKEIAETRNLHKKVDIIIQDKEADLKENLFGLIVVLLMYGMLFDNWLKYVGLLVLIIATAGGIMAVYKAYKEWNKWVSLKKCGESLIDLGERVVEWSKESKSDD